MDLKLKHNTVVDSRKTLNLTHSIAKSTAQTQDSIEQTTRLAEKADKEGSTILVFTIVSVIFVGELALGRCISTLTGLAASYVFYGNHVSDQYSPI